MLARIKKNSDHFVKKLLCKLQNTGSFQLLTYCDNLILVLKYGKGSLNSLQNAKNELAVMSSTIEWIKKYGKLIIHTFFFSCSIS